MPNFQEGLVVTQNFTGCVENMYLNATNVISELRQGYESGEPFKFTRVNTLYACPVSISQYNSLRKLFNFDKFKNADDGGNFQEPPVVPITFLKEGSYAKLRGYAGGTTLNISLEFRTYEIHGLLIYHKFNTDGHVKVSASINSSKLSHELNSVFEVIYLADFGWLGSD